MDQTKAPPVLFERVGEHVAVITLNRPHARNAINAEMALLIEQLVAQVEGDPTIRAAIIAAEGTAFCAGADLKEVAAGGAEALSRPLTGFAGFVYGERVKPWIAAVQGPAHGGGAEIALACDMIMAADTAAFALPEVKRGLIAGAGGCIRLGRAIPRAVALEMVMTGDAIDADRAYAVGLVNRVVSAASVRDEAIRMAEVIAANSPLSVRESRRLTQLGIDLSDRDIRELQAAAIETVVGGPDLIEGAMAFVQKRAPVWKS